MKSCGIVATVLAAMFALPAAAEGPSTVTVDTQTGNGSSDRIGDFLGFQGGLALEGTAPPGYDPDAYDHWLLDAWRGVSLHVGQINLFETSPDGGGAQVWRGKDGRPVVDPTPLRASLEHVLDPGALACRSVAFCIGYMPPAISMLPEDHEDAQYVAPADYEEWKYVVRETVRYITSLKEEFHIERVDYMVWEEAESTWYWRGRNRDLADPESRREILGDYLELYRNTWEAVKEIDPEARVGGAHTMTWFPYDGTAFTLEDFLEALARSNEASCGAPVTIDRLVWQDYNWGGFPRMSTGAAAVRQMLKRHGYPEDTPQVVLGWNRGWGYDPDGGQDLHDVAAHIAGNIVDQASPSGGGGLERAYLWPFDHDTGYAGIAVVTAPAEEQWIDPMGGVGERQYIPPVKEFSLRPAYAALQMLRGMMGGEFLTTAQSCGSPLEVMAVRTETRVSTILVNDTAQDHDTTLTFTGLAPSDGWIEVLVQWIDPDHSSDGQGLEKGSSEWVSVTGGEARIKLSFKARAVARVSLAQ